MAALSYHEQEDIENTKRIRGILKELPPFCTDFFRGIEPRTSARTRLAYAYDLKTFFDFLKQANPELKSKKLRDLPLSLLDEIDGSGRIYGVSEMLFDRKTRGSDEYRAGYHAESLDG